MIKAISSKFWTEVCGDWPARFFTMLDSVLAAQPDDEAAAAKASLGPKSFKPFKSERFKPLFFGPYDVKPPKAILDGSAALDGSEPLSGRRAAGYSLPAPAGLIGADYISTAPDGSGRMLEAARDFIVDAEAREIVFRQDPLGLPVRWDSSAGGREGRLWLIGARLDDGTAARTSRMFAGISVPCGARTADITGALCDCLVNGTAKASLALALGYILDAETSKVAGVVERVFKDAGRTWVLAEGLLHSAPGSCSAVVAAGSKVRRGDLLFDAFTLLGEGSELDPVKVPALFIGPELTGGRLVDGVMVDNAEMAAPASRWLLASKRGGKGLVEDVTESDYSYLIDRLDGGDAYLLVDDGLDEYKLTVGSSGPPCQGPPRDVAAFKAYVNEAEARGVSFPAAVAAGRNEKLRMNPAAEIWNGALARSCALLMVDPGLDRGAWRLLTWLAGLMPAWTFLRVCSEQPCCDTYACADSVSESVEVFDCVDVEDGSCSINENINTTRFAL